MKKLMTFMLALSLGACSGGGPTGPDPVVTQPEAPVATTTAAPAPVAPVPAPQAPGKEHNASVKAGYYSVKNETGARAFYCVASFGVLPGGEQGAGTNLFQEQGERNAGDWFEGQAPKTAACQYDRIQIDLTQSKDCKNFDWTNVLAAEVIPNPGYVEGSKKAKLEALSYDEWSTWGPWSGEGCGTRTRTRKVYEQFKYECSGEVVRVEVRTETDTQTKDCCAYPSPSFQLSGLTFPTYTPAVPAVPGTPKYYFYDGENSGIQNDCQDEGGTFYPNLDSRSNVCRTTVNHGNEWEYDNNDDADLYKTQNAVAAIPAVPASGGNPISGTATVSGAGVWKLILRATDPGNYEKNVKSVTLTCNSQPATLTVSYTWVGHDSEKWKLELYRDNVLVATSPIITSSVN